MPAKLRAINAEFRAKAKELGSELRKQGTFYSGYRISRLEEIASVTIREAARGVFERALQAQHVDDSITVAEAGLKGLADDFRRFLSSEIIKPPISGSRDGGLARSIGMRFALLAMDIGYAAKLARSEAELQAKAADPGTGIVDATKPRKVRRRSDKPPLPDAELDRWVEKNRSRLDSLNKLDIWALCLESHPQNHVVRERIEERFQGRKRGRRPITEKQSG